MSRNWVLISIISLVIAAVLGGFYGYFRLQTQESSDTEPTPQPIQNPIKKVVEKVIEPEPKVVLPTPPQRKVLNNDYHIFQTFNNCGPASLSMALSYYGVNITQQELGQALRPYQNPQGDNDDKSTTLEELAEKSKDYGLIPYHRPNGTVDIVKSLIANDMPVVARTWLKVDDDIGHYRVIKGYDDVQGIFIQDDSLQGKNLEYAYDDFFAIWKPFSFEYLVMVPEDKVQIVEAILGDNVDSQYAWEETLKVWQNELEQNPNDVNARFNVSIALYNLGRYQESVDEFEKVENRLPSRALWYQIEPIHAYYELENYDRVFEITDRILNNHNRAFSELYLIRGNIYRNQGDITRARSEYQKAFQYNTSQKKFQEALDSI